MGKARHKSFFEKVSWVPLVRGAEALSKHGLINPGKYQEKEGRQHLCVTEQMGPGLQLKGAGRLQVGQLVHAL